MDGLQFGARLRELRNAASLTQKELGARLHVTPQAVANWERGRALPQLTDLPFLVSALGVTISEFYLDAPRCEAGEPDIEIVTPSGETVVVRVKAGPGKSRTAEFLQTVVSGLLGNQARRVHVTIDKDGDNNHRPSADSPLPGATFARLLLEEIRAMNIQDRRELIDTLSTLSE
jgi:transcriptional regulator with XRE-family HTH domain